MQKMEILRNKLYEAIENGDKKEIYSLSKKLDKEILKYTSKFDGGSKNKKEGGTAG